MGRNSNDDRSDSKNPNNDSYRASLLNHYTQLGDCDDDGPVYQTPRASYRVSMPPLPRKPQLGDPETPLTLVIKEEPLSENQLKYQLMINEVFRKVPG